VGGYKNYLLLSHGLYPHHYYCYLSLVKKHLEKVHWGKLNVNGKIKLDIMETACDADKLME
jgi:hypothetical protein